MNTWLILGLALFVYMCSVYMVSILVKRNDVADIAWGPGFILMAWLSCYLEGMPRHAFIINGLITIWGLRLAWHIGTRWMKGPEDFRYKQWRQEWNNFYLRSFLQVYMLQGTLIFIVALPVICVNMSDDIANYGFYAIGILVWLAGFLFESIGDLQLKKFKEKPENKGRILTTGLWAYTRHPNYFGDAVQWWGIFTIALSCSGGWVTVISPIVMTYLLRFVSGVPMLEEKYKDHPDFIEYASKTPVFIPFWGRK